MRRNRRRPRSARVAARAIKLLASTGTTGLLVVSMIVAFASCGARVLNTAAGEDACQLPDTVGGPGALIVGDSALLGLAAVLPHTLAGGPVRADVRAGRTAQQGLDTLASLPDTAPHIVIMSLSVDDASAPRAYTDRIDELMLTLAGRDVYWITAPGGATGAAHTRVVEHENTGTGTGGGGDPEQQGGWHIVDLAAAVGQHPEWWHGRSPTATGLRHLAATLQQTVTATADTPTTGTDTTGTGATTGATIAVTSTTSGETFPLTDERRRNAVTIIDVGTRLGVPVRGQVIAIATAIQESRLINLPGGDRDSAGLFQQRPSAGWGTHEQVTDPTRAAAAFYRHLLGVPGWQELALTQAAQAVQNSATPTAYAQWEQTATVIVAALTGQHAAGCGPQVDVPGSPRAQIAVNAALSQLGVPYAFAGGDLAGPTAGVCEPATDAANDCHVIGFDCSGLMLYAWGRAGVSVPHFTGAMWTDPAFVHITDRTQLQPGDMMMFESPPGHTGMYLGGGRLIDAPHSGAVVRIVAITDPWYAQNYIGALRPRT